MPDGSKYDVPAKIIAENRAAYYNERDEDTTYEEEFDYTMEDDGELIDWATNNMDWDEVSDHAVLAGISQPDYQEGWVNGEHEVVELD